VRADTDRMNRFDCFQGSTKGCLGIAAGRCLEEAAEYVLGRSLLSVELGGREQVHANEMLAVSGLIVPNDASRNALVPFKF